MHYNIAPGSAIEAVRMREGSRGVQLLAWGLVPYWAKDAAIAHKTINARAESAHASPAFRAAFSARRCLIVADGYYEWQRAATQAKRTIKQPHFICMRERGVFSFGGLWECWRGPQGDHYSCTILTVDANELTRPIHDRMPAIIRPQDYDAWLDPDLKDTAAIQALLAPYPSEAMQAWPVGTQVNDARSDGAQLLLPSAPTLAAQSEMLF